MAITAKPSSPSGPPSAADWAAISVSAALETSITAAVVASSKERSSRPIDDMMYEDEATYKEELTNYTYKRAVAY
jgi:hypothetical protein